MSVDSQKSSVIVSRALWILRADARDSFGRRLAGHGTIRSQSSQLGRQTGVASEHHGSLYQGVPDVVVSAGSSNEVVFKRDLGSKRRGFVTTEAWIHGSGGHGSLVPRSTTLGVRPRVGKSGGKFMMSAEGRCAPERKGWR
jgi:hypothetical protein